MLIEGVLDQFKDRGRHVIMVVMAWLTRVAHGTSPPCPAQQHAHGTLH